MNNLKDLSPLISGLAYLDPGSGSFILQILLASLLGALFLVRTYWQKILSFFRGGSKDDAPEPSISDEEDRIE